MASAVISNERARRIALAAQGFRHRRPVGRVDRRHFRRVIDHTGVLQLDSVNVVCRAHYMPAWSRLGPYDREALDRWAYGGALFEYWAHEAALAPVEHHHLFRHRMDGPTHWGALARFGAENREYVAAVLDHVHAAGPLSVADLHERGTRTGPWWGRDKGKLALEYLFDKGKVTAAHRHNFMRFYDVPERLIPGEVLDRDPVPEAEACAELLMLAARSLGVGTAEDLGDYYRIRMPVVRPLIDRLVADGRLEPVQVQGWAKPAYLHPEATAPRSVPGRALLSPFDPVVWYRDRAERLFEFTYRIEIYVPEAKRRYGYYVLPFLLDGALVGRVDLKADRAAGRLVVKGAWHEDGTDPVRVAAELGDELADFAGWLGLDDVEIVDNGTLAGHLGAGSVVGHAGRPANKGP